MCLFEGILIARTVSSILLCGCFFWRLSTRCLTASSSPKYQITVSFRLCVCNTWSWLMIAQRQERNWVDFVDWCRARRLKSLPAHPWTLAAYARWCDKHYRRSNVSKRIKAIARAHIFFCAASPDRHPTVISTLRAIERQKRSRVDRAALFRSEDFAVMDTGKRGALKSKPKRNLKKSPDRCRRSLRSSPPLVSRRPVDR